MVSKDRIEEIRKRVGADPEFYFDIVAEEDLQFLLSEHDHLTAENERLRQHLGEVAEEAERFLRAYKARREAFARRLNRDERITNWEPAKENAALRRASMDLTRALADMRQGRE